MGPGRQVDQASATLISMGQAVVSFLIVFGIVWLPLILTVLPDRRNRPRGRPPPRTQPLRRAAAGHAPDDTAVLGGGLIEEDRANRVDGHPGRAGQPARPAHVQGPPAWHDLADDRAGGAIRPDRGRLCPVVGPDHRPGGRHGPRRDRRRGRGRRDPARGRRDRDRDARDRGDPPLAGGPRHGARCLVRDDREGRRGGGGPC